MSSTLNADGMPLPSKVTPAVEDGTRSRSLTVAEPAPACLALAKFDASSVISRAFLSVPVPATAVWVISILVDVEVFWENRAVAVDARSVAATSLALSAETSAVTAPDAPLPLLKLTAIPPLVVAPLEDSSNSNVKAVVPPAELAKVTVIVSPSAGVVVISRRPDEAYTLPALFNKTEVAAPEGG